MRKLFVIALLTFTSCLGFSQKNIELQSRVNYSQRLSDIWGYTDVQGNEYALVCLRAGVAIENITNPRNPRRVALIPSPHSTWRDAKTYGEFAYFTNENNGGIQIINLKNLPNPPDSSDVYFWAPVINETDTLSACHNLYIDETTGYGFLAGCTNTFGGRIFGGGVLIIDLFTDPANPKFLAAGASIYAHDVFARGNLVYSSDIFDGTFAIQDISSVSDNVTTINRQSSPFQFTHNTWLSEDGNTIFTTDETRDAPIGAYDISDKNNIKLLDEFRPISSIGTGLIPHNVHVKNDFLVTSYYTEGVIITDANRPENLIEVGNYDTYEGENGNFNGVWGAYPFFESGTIIASDIQSGLYIFKPNYIRACYLEGMVLDSISGVGLDGVQVSILSNDANSAQSDLMGSYKTGQATSGNYQVTFSKLGYTSKTVSVSLENGELVNLNIALVPDNLSTAIPSLDNVESIKTFPNPFIEATTLEYQFTKLEKNTRLIIKDVLGRLVEQFPINQASGFLPLGSNWQSGIYFLHFEANGAISSPEKIIKVKN